jgi:tetratricopeptide (TPR) repeat protein
MKRAAGFLLLLAAVAAFARPQGAAAPAREVRVLVLADEEVRERPDWQQRVTAAMAFVSGEFERLFHIRLAIRRFGAWRSEDALRSLDLLIEKVDAEADRGDCEVVLALTAQRNLQDRFVGLSMYKEGTLLARVDDGPPDLERVLEHEWGHLFGAVHIADRGSVMDSLLQGGEFGALNSRIILLHRDRPFNGVDFPLPQEKLAGAAEIYSLICVFNARAKAVDRDRPLPPEVPGVSISHRLLDVLDEAGRRDMSALDDAYVLLAEVELERKELGPALEACRDALRLNPENVETRNLLGVISRRQGRIDEAIETYEAILKEKPRSARFLYNMGIARVKKGETETAMGLYRRAVEIRPSFTEAWNNIGELELRAGRLDEAEQAFVKAASLNRAFALAHSNLAEVCVRKKAFDRALAEVRLALEQRPDLPGPHNVHGNLLHQQGRTEEAVREYEAVLAIDPEYEKAYYNLGICLFEAGRIEEAAAKFMKAIELVPRFSEAHASLGYALIMLKRVDDGVVEIRQAQELGLVSAKTHLNLSYAHLLRDEAGAAAIEAQRAIELDPSLAMAYNNLGIAHARKRAYGEAERAFRKALEIDRSYKDAYAGLGSVLTVLGRKAEGLQVLLKAATLDPKDGTLLGNIAVLEYQLGSYEASREHAWKALALGAKLDPAFLEGLEKARKREPA